MNLFNEIAKEALTGEIYLNDDGVQIPVRILFNIALENSSPEFFNIYIKDKNNFEKVLNDYILTALEFYDLEPNKDNIKTILTYAFVNITENEMKAFDEYLLKYIEFYKNKINISSGKKETSIGSLKFSVDKQSFKQETPYCFNSYFAKEDLKYYLPRISFGIKDGVCYIYAIQNKSTKLNTNLEYSEEVQGKLRTINSGISKYRNVTPSFVCALVLFLSFLKQNGISEIRVVTPLPLREQNRELSSKQRIKFYTAKYNLDVDSIDKLTKEINDKKDKDNYNATVKFLNCFKRLQLHFDDIRLFEVNKEILLHIIDLSAKNKFLQELILEKENDYGKISKYSSSKS